MGEDVSPRPHPRHVDLAIGERDGDPRPVRRRHEIEVTPERLGHVGEERLIRRLGLGGCRLQGPDAEAKLAPVLGGSRMSDRPRERRERRECEGKTVGLAGL
jgi:hypothetical protein